MHRLNSLLFVFLLATFLTSTSVLAQEATSSTSTVLTTPEVATVKRTFVTEPTLQKIAQTRLTNLAANMSNRMDAAVSRLQNVTDRLTSRLNKMAEEGKNVDTARNELTQAQTKLDEAKRNLITIDTEVNAFIGSATPRENWQNLKNNYKGTGAAIVAAHQNILAAIATARNAGVVPTPEVSSSTDTTNN